MQSRCFRQQTRDSGLAGLLCHSYSWGAVVQRSLTWQTANCLHFSQRSEVLRCFLITCAATPSQTRCPGHRVHPETHPRPLPVSQQTLLIDSNAFFYYGHGQAILINHEWAFLIIHPSLKANILPLSLGPALPFPLAQPFPGPGPKPLPLTSFQRAKACQGHW